MAQVQTIDKNQHAIDNAAAWYESIRAMVADLRRHREAGNDREIDAATEEITGSVLSVMVRDGWRNPCDTMGATDTEEYEILLTTGGPALRIYGRLDHGEPDADPIIQWQDWGTPWTDWWPEDRDVPYKDTLREFACCFWFGD
jgi:hypothetical protein